MIIFVKSKDCTTPKKHDAINRNHFRLLEFFSTQKIKQKFIKAYKPVKLVAVKESTFPSTYLYGTYFVLKAYWRD